MAPTLTDLVPTAKITTDPAIQASVHLDVQRLLDRGRYKSREDWAKAILSDEEPVELYAQPDGVLLLGDGNHRYFAATVLGRDVPAVIYNSPVALRESSANDLTDLERTLLVEFGEENGAPSGAVAQHLGISTVRVTQAAKSLAARGLLEDTGYAMKYVSRTANWQWIDKPKTEGGMHTKPGASTVWRATRAGLAAIEREPSPHVDWKD